MDSELGRVGKMDRTCWWVFVPQVILVFAVCAVYYADDPLGSLFLILMIVIGGGIAASVADICVRWYPDRELLYIPVVVVSAFLGASMVLGVLIWFAGSFVDGVRALGYPFQAVFLLPLEFVDSVQDLLRGEDVLLRLFPGLISIQTAVFLAISMWKRNRLWRTAFSFSLVMWIVSSTWCAGMMGLLDS